MTNDRARSTNGEGTKDQKGEQGGSQWPIFNALLDANWQETGISLS